MTMISEKNYVRESGKVYRYYLYIHVHQDTSMNTKIAYVLFQCVLFHQVFQLMTSIMYV